MQPSKTMRWQRSIYYCFKSMLSKISSKYFRCLVYDHTICVSYCGFVSLNISSIWKSFYCTQLHNNWRRSKEINRTEGWSLAPSSHLIHIWKFKCFRHQPPFSIKFLKPVFSLILSWFSS